MYKNYKVTKLSLMVGATFIATSVSAVATEVTSMNIKTKTANGAPTFVTGNLGSMTANSAAQALKDIINSQVEFEAKGNENFTVSRQWVDELGKNHTHLRQTINGLKVYGTSMIIHANASIGLLNNGNASSQVYGISGRLAHNDYAAMNSLMSGSSSNSSAKKALAAAKVIGDVLGSAELVYIYLPLSEETKLSYRIEVSWDYGDDDFGRDFIYFDTNNFDVLTREPQIHSAKNWRTYTLNGGAANTAPGTLLCSNNQNCGGNAAAQRAHDGASKVYDYYQSKFGRDSLDNNGMTMISSVDMGVVNAYWTGTQMMYGQASSGMNDFTSDFDIIGHELTHGVTGNSAQLVYANASGALNEAWSDILGLSAEAYKNGITTSTWLLGDDLYENQPGKAFRYMNNPTQDGYSKDWWPERIAYVSNPSNDNDNGGVHGNSGIANLAYVLLVDGGTHPRNKSTAQVPSIGMAKAEKIFYRALTTYMNQSTNFAGARSATAQAAQDLYGATEKTAVETAWCAVGVGTCPDGGTTTPTDGVLENGVATTNISGTAKQQNFYTLEVPANATALSFTTSGGTGDADLYVKFDSKPSLTTQDCKSTSNGNTESCTIANVQAGTYHVMVEAWNEISGVSLTGSYSGGSSNTDTVLENGVAKTSISGTAKQQLFYTLEVPENSTGLSFSTSGGSGDADLYVMYGSRPSLTASDCKSTSNGNTETCTIATAQAGTYYVMVEAWSTISGVSLTGSFTAGGTSGGNDPIYGTLSNIAVTQGQWQRYTQVLPAGYSNMTISISGGRGDADLYIRQGAQSTSTLYDCRPYLNGNTESCSFSSPAEGTWYIDIYGYQTVSGLTLTLEATP
ncbi:MAG: M4 family metallopeptidase [Colwellia sp.]|nr:M4 family metallopeptidase [Colwellia sp.]